MEQNKKTLSKNTSEERNPMLSPKSFIEQNTPRHAKHSLVKNSMTIKQVTNPNDKTQTIVNILKKHSDERNERDLLIMVPLVREIAFFKQRNIQGQDLVQICSEMKHEYYKEGEAVFKQGEYGDKFYVVLKGEVGVKIPDPKRKNDPPKQQTQQQQQQPGQSQKPSLVIQTQNNATTLIEQHRRLTILSNKTQKHIQENKTPQNAVFMTMTNEVSPKTTKVQNNNVASLTHYMEQVKSQRRSTINNLNPASITVNRLSMKRDRTKQSMHLGQMLIKDNDDILERDQEDSEDENINAHPDIKSIAPSSQIDQDEVEDMIYENQTNTQESIEEESVEDQMTVFARIQQEDDGFIQVAKLVDGSSFGELALLEQKPRAATIRCLQNSHFMVLTKNDYIKVIGKIERRTYNEKINFLRNIPVFSLLTRTSLGKMTYYFESKTCIRDSLLYKEGDPAEYVYIIKNGEFQATKRILHTGPKQEKIEEILENPIKANKHKNNLFSKNILRKIEKINLFIIGSGQLVGDEDICVNSPTYQTTVRCLSQQADLIRLKKEDFLRLQSQGPTWNEILKSVTEKKKKIQLCLFQTRSSINRIENQLDQDQNNLKDHSKQNDKNGNMFGSSVNDYSHEKSNRFKKSNSHNHSSQVSMDFNKKSGGMNYLDMIKAFGQSDKEEQSKTIIIQQQDSPETTSMLSKQLHLLEQTQNSLPSIQDNRQIYLSLKHAKQTKSNDRTSMTQTIRFHANQLKTLRPQATLFPLNFHNKTLNNNESQVSSGTLGLQSHNFQLANNVRVASSKLQQQILPQSDEYSLRSQSHLKTKYRLKRRLQKIGLSQNYQQHDSQRNKNLFLNPFSQNNQIKNHSMKQNDFLENERNALNKTTLGANLKNRNLDDNSLQGGDSYISTQIPKLNKTILLTTKASNANEL